MGGATIQASIAVIPCIGLSPRGRGNRHCAFEFCQRHRSIPAWAGQPITHLATAGYNEVYPRVGGATRGLVGVVPLPQGLSPRGRGNLVRTLSGSTRARSIPAWAGQPMVQSHMQQCAKVYPRVGGATYTAATRARNPAGLSPRGRGNLILSHGVSENVRSIPAWAGQPKSCFRYPTPARVYPRVGGATLGSCLYREWL